ncbi:MAG: SDR family oxidoreductase [Acidobacteria bacterium]|nr:MAG: SDR family oxidoreductase [Acidobacteriota bacterium]
MKRDPFDLSGRHALVCGGSAGIGRAAALALAERGARVTALARSRDALERLTGELRQAGAPEARYLAADHDDRPALEARVRDFLARHGPVHVLVNNSGGPPPGPILEASAEDFLHAFGRHLLASHLLVRLILPGMVEDGYGRIINVISTSVREPLPGLGVSNAIRGAVASWAKTLARELPAAVTINNLLPGFTDTERLAALAERLAAGRGTTPEQVRQEWIASVPAGRIGRPEELGWVVAFLASPAASYVRGVSLPVDGGRLQSI